MPGLEGQEEAVGVRKSSAETIRYSSEPALLGGRLAELEVPVVLPHSECYFDMYNGFVAQVVRFVFVVYIVDHLSTVLEPYSDFVVIHIRVDFAAESFAVVEA